MSNIIDSIQLSGVTYTLQGSGGGTVSSAITSGDTNAVAGGAVYDKFDEVEQVTARALNDLDEKINPTVELTQAQYDALVSAGTVDPNTFYVITDAKPIETSGFVQTSAITSSVTSASTDSQIPTAKAVWEAASGGGSTYTAGRGIDITSDTISVSLPISAGTGSYSIQEGQNTKATGNYSHAEGQGTIAKGYRSHAEGDSTIANAGGSHAEGSGSIASGYYSHAEGNSTSATSDSSHAEGRDTIASGYYSHAEGWATTASGQSSHAEGESTVASGARSHAEGYGTKASGDSSHAEGNYTKTTNKYEHASGSYNNSVSASTTFGDSGNTLFSVGNGTGNNARHNAFEIRQNGDIYLSSGGTDIKLQDHLGGGGASYSAGRGIDITSDTISVSLPISAGTGSYSIQEGQNTKATGSYSHAEGLDTIASGYYSHAEGNSTSATSYSSHAEGETTLASGDSSHAEGYRTTASGDSSHAEGLGTIASGDISHAEGNGTTASGQSSHAEGYSTKASGDSSHAEGSYTVTSNDSEHASGKYNVSSKASTTFGDSGNTLFSVGNGTSESARHNAFEIRQNGDIYLTKDGQDVKLQDQLGGGSITVDTALDSASTNPVENRVIYNKIDEVEQVTARALNELNDTFGGLKLVKLTQAEYNALATKDSSTLYIIVN